MPPKNDNGTDMTSAQGHDIPRGKPDRAGSNRPAAAEQKRRDDGEEARCRRRRGVVARETRDEFSVRAFFSDAFSTNSRMRLTVRVLEGLGCACGEDAREVDATRDDLVAVVGDSRHRLAR